MLYKILLFSLYWFAGIKLPIFSFHLQKTVGIMFLSVSASLRLSGCLYETRLFHGIKEVQMSFSLGLES